MPGVAGERGIAVYSLDIPRISVRRIDDFNRTRYRQLIVHRVNAAVIEMALK